MNGRFPSMTLPVLPPMAPMDGPSVEALPSGAGWLYEPQWDGFRCLAFRDGSTVALQAKNGEPIARYFPELVMALVRLPQTRFVLDGEIVVAAPPATMTTPGASAREELLARFHPSVRKVAQLSARTPATLCCFDLLCEGEESLLAQKLSERRKRLERFFLAFQKAQLLQKLQKAPRSELLEAGGVSLSPSTTRRPEALAWLPALGSGPSRLVVGLVARRASSTYGPDDGAGAKGSAPGSPQGSMVRHTVEGRRKKGPGLERLGV